MDYIFSDRIKSLQPSAIREILKFTQDPSVISFAAGNPAPEAFPVAEISEISKNLLEQNPVAALQYSISEGYTPLRTALVENLKRSYGIGSENDDLIIVSGAQQGSELSCKALCNEHETIICEDPTFIGVLNAFRSYNAHLAGVKIDDDGINIELLEQALKDNPNTKLIYVIPNFQNPTGVVMSLEKRKAVYELAKKYNVMIIEDNPYGDLRFSGKDIPSIKAFDTDGRVIYCGTFSKLLAPGMRVGYVLAPKPVIAKLTVAKQVSDVHSNIWAQIICERFITQYDIKSHIAKMQDIYRKKCALMISEMQKHFSEKVKFSVPEGGLFIWCTLPEGSNMMEFCTVAVRDYKIAVVPGTAFTVAEGAPSNSFRMNFSTPTDDAIVKGVEILGRLTKQMFD
ncbi:MAG TPA: PLP-dependent aminotransferase family protein [Ruminococcaceae bacterium]|nr:PLP-dependent aminotransferase family protein [Oscillospiraceae bacterium]